MQYKKVFDTIMQKGENLVLATSVEGHPNVRIMNYYYDPESKSLYVSTFGHSQKVKEFEHNENVAFSILYGEQALRVKDAKITPSSHTIDEVKAGFIAKDPDFAAIAQIPGILLYEIGFSEARVIAGFKQVEDIAV